MKRILHFFPTISHLGGVESILRLHARLDKDRGWDSLVLIACESDEACRAFGASGLNVRGWNDLATLRRRFRRALTSFNPDVVVFHNLWAGRHLMAEARSCRRVGMLHTASEETFVALANCCHALDLILAVSPALAEKAREMSEGRVPVVALDYPIDPRPPPTRAPEAGQPFLVGYAGRLTTEQKRCDRLTTLIDETLKLSPRIRFEIMGTGPDEARMREHFRGNSSVVFLGRKQGDDYWAHLGEWDAIVFTSDYEGTPLALLEAMSQGVLPLYPRIGSGGDAYVDQVDPTLLYEKEDLRSAADRLVSLSQEQEAELAIRRSRAVSLTQKHRPELYLESFFSPLESSQFSRNFAMADVQRKPSLSDFLPFYVIKRWRPQLIY